MASADDPRHLPMHFMLVEGELLISHAVATFREIEHRAERFLVGGLSTVFTFPAHRKTGAGREVVVAATRHLRDSDADVAMLFCGESLRGFYVACGWAPVDTARICYGDSRQPALTSDNLVMIMFLSTRGRAARQVFESEPVYVGPQTW
jgi:predicted acetyltransferase